MEFRLSYGNRTHVEKDIGAVEINVPVILESETAYLLRDTAVVRDAYTLYLIPPHRLPEKLSENEREYRKQDQLRVVLLYTGNENASTPMNETGARR